MSIDINKIVLENYEFAPNTVRITNEDGYLFTIPHSRKYKRTKKDCDIIGKEIVARFNNHDKLIEAIKNVIARCEFELEGMKVLNDIEFVRAKQLLKQIEKETL